MKAKLEPKEIQHRGVSLTSETEEEKQILTDCWVQQCSPAMFARVEGGQVELVIVPTPLEVDK